MEERAVDATDSRPTAATANTIVTADQHPFAGYRAEIDGLRAVAVVPVILFHLGLPWCAGGYVGVDVFFVISGFLITRLMLGELQREQFSLTAFWARRIRRVVPAMLMMCAVTVGTTFAMVFPFDWPEIGRQALAALGAFSNVYSWKMLGDYWGQSAEGSPFLHMWSLSVEEQFYLLYPPLLLLLYRLRPTRIQSVLATALVVSIVGCLYGRATYPRATFYLLPTRAWELLTGCLLATTAEYGRGGRRAQWWSRMLEMLAIPAILVAFTLPWVGSARDILAVVGAAAVIRHPGGVVNTSILRNRFSVVVGRLSYSLYLWHWPVIVLTKEVGIWSAWPMQLLVACSIAVVCYRFVECPVRGRDDAVPWIAAAYVGAIGLATSLLVVRHTYDTSEFATSEFLGVRYAVNLDDPIRASRRPALEGVRWPQQIAGPDAYRTGGVIIPGRQKTPAVVVLGDSHGLMWSDVIQGIAAEADATLSLWSMAGESPALRFPLADHSGSGRRLSPQERLAYDSSRVRLIEQWKPKLVVVCRRWTVERSGGLNELVDFLCRHAENVLLVEQPPEIAELKDRNLLQYVAFLGVKPCDGVRRYLPILDPARGEEARSLVRALAARHPSCTVLPLHDVYASEDDVLVLDGRKAVYTDDDHLTTYGAGLATARFREAILGAISGSQGH